ncbi:MAG: aminotransferase class V-fold PLP-dependent enzyme, partial [Planctomycetaceae bacterium]
MTQSSHVPTFDVEVVRRDFPIFDRHLSSNLPLTYLDSGASAQKPRSVIDKERQVYETYYANAYRGVYRFGAQIDDEMEAVRETLRVFLGARSSEEIIFTSGATMSINLVARCWGGRHLQPGDEILLNETEHHANLVPWQMVAKDTGAQLRFIPLMEDGRLDLARLDDVLGERTKLIAISGMSNVLGSINPISEIVSRAQKYGALVAVDGAQSVPHFATDVCCPQVDFLSFSGHKLFGPSGVGVLYGRQELLEDMDPFLGGGHMIASVERQSSTWAQAPAKFEAGTPAIAQAIALGTAVDYVTSLGWEAIQCHEHGLLKYAHQRLLEVPGMRIHGPGVEHTGAIISFPVEDANPEDLAHLLDRCGVFVRHG